MLTADVVVVGSGVAGALVAYRLARAGVRVVILEAGPRLDRATLVARFRTMADKHYMSPYPYTAHAPQPDPGNWESYLILERPHPYKSQYVRAVGGTTWHWAAAAWRFIPNDFRLYSAYRVGRDWPLSYADLESWYQEAEEELGVAGNPDDDLNTPRSKPYPLPPIPLSSMDRLLVERLNGKGFHVVTEPVARFSRPFRGQPPCCGNNNCMPICPIGAQYSADMHVAAAERAGARLIENAVVHQVVAGPDRRIMAVRYKDPSGAEHEVAGRVFVLAANGIETPKLMLISRSEAWPEGIGNSSGMVGCNLMDHAGTGADFILKDPAYPGRGPQEITSIVNQRDGPFRREYCARKYHFLNQPDMEAITRHLLGQGVLGPELDHRIRHRATHRIQVYSFHEQLPDPENRIVPAWDQRDAIGIPRPRIRYAIGDYVRRGAERSRLDYARIGELLGATEVTFRDDFAPNNHLVGTTIMGRDPKDSVVDQDGRCHDHPNLFIAGSSVFPTIGSVNPTLTIAALSLRTADIIRHAMKDGAGGA